MCRFTGPSKSFIWNRAFLCAPFWQSGCALYQSVWGYFLLLAKLNSSRWLSENINLYLMFLVGLEWVIKSRPQNSTQCVELVTWRRLPIEGLPLDTFALSLSAACGDMWQTHCMHAVTVRVPRWALSRQRGPPHRVIGKTCSWLHSLGTEHVRVFT